MALGTSGTLTGGAAFIAASSEAQVAKGDIITSLDNEPAHHQRGIDRSVAMGGNVGGVEYMRDTGPSLATATMFNRNGRGFALSAGHVGVFSDFTFFTGWDAVNNRGLEYRPVNVEVFPGYSLGMSPLGSTPDIALFTFDGLIQGAPDLVFPDAPLSFGDSLVHGGFGELGVYGQGMLGQDGNARAGVAYSVGASLLGGANADTYSALGLSRSDPNSSRAARGSSGNPGQKEVDDIIKTYLLVTQASSSPLGLTTQGVRLDKQHTQFHDWFDGRIAAATAVPEPSSAGLLATALGVLAFWRRWRRSNA